MSALPTRVSMAAGVRTSQGVSRVPARRAWAAYSVRLTRIVVPVVLV